MIYSNRLHRATNAAIFQGNKVSTSTNKSCAQTWMLNPEFSAHYNFYRVKDGKLLSATTRVRRRSGLELNENAIHILEQRYLRKDEAGNVVEAPEDMFMRVADKVASAEQIYGKEDPEKMAQAFYRMMIRLEFLPNSPTLLNSNRNSGMLSAVYYVPIEDNIESIYEAVRNAALIHKAGGGTSFSFSNIRPKGDKMGEIHGASQGPVELIDVFSKATHYVKQGGIRSGCNTVALDVTHPDILEFIKAKLDPEALPNFYISVAMSDEFMEKIKRREDYDLINPRTKEVAGRLNAGKVFDLIVDCVWHTGDPGVIFMDRINRASPIPNMEGVQSISGCGEQTLMPYECSNLGSINLTQMVKTTADGTVEVDYDKLDKTIKLAMRFLDNVIDVNRYPLKETADMTLKYRKVGLGVMGFADMLLLLGIPYNSDEAVAIAESVMGFVQQKAHAYSSALAEERGAFPEWGNSKFAQNGVKMRNASCTTISPTGTLSIIAGCSSSVEPSYAMVFVRNMQDGEMLLEINPYFEAMAKRLGFHSVELYTSLVQSNNVHLLSDVPDEIKKIFVTSHCITPQWHVKIQTAFQRHLDNAVSKTVNFPNSATREDIARVFMEAYDQGSKGITVYRDGSRERQPLANDEKGVCLLQERQTEDDGYKRMIVI